MLQKPLNFMIFMSVMRITSLQYGFPKKIQESGASHDHDPESASCFEPTLELSQEHFKVAMRRTCRVVNLDPAAENFLYDCYVDVRLHQGQSLVVLGIFGDGMGEMHNEQWIFGRWDWLKQNRWHHKWMP